MSEDEWDEVLNTNLRSIFLMTRAVTRPMMSQRYGRIINMSSVSGIIGNAGQSNYSASKAGLIGFTRTVAKELGSRKITVNAVCPGFIETEMTEALGPALQDEVKKRVPAKRLGQPGVVDQDVEAVAKLIDAVMASTLQLFDDLKAYGRASPCHLVGGGARSDRDR